MNEIVHPTFILPNVDADLYAQSLELSIPVLDEHENIYSASNFIRDRLAGLNAQAGNIMKIPRIIHQVYEDPAGPPEMLSRISSTWREHHPEWEYRFWDRQAIENFMETHYPDLIPHYRSFPYNVQRWDAVRYLILYHFGGLYADMDYECMEPLDTLLGDSTCCIGMEPKHHALRYNMPFIAGNALMAATPGHNYFKMVIDDLWIHQKDMEIIDNKGMAVMNTTGPFMITRLYSACISKEDITLLPPELVAPLTYEEVRLLVENNAGKEIEEKVENAYAIHYFFGSWFSQMK
jgi:mannosyltransferase OCH1-like enzyme